MNELVFAAYIVATIIILGWFIADYWKTKRELRYLKRALKTHDKTIQYLTPKRDRKGRFIRKS